ncbi:mitochondrial 18 KDa protein-domain-containing protein [Lipomyces kononenkoae]|uniref:Mitochondrial 18 kDa protein-domain-containing protein n=1 Tax=Lipomyces kononenkoae TaxID=34357 RepID=A0ACC3SZ69_LIPKO
MPDSSIEEKVEARVGKAAHNIASGEAPESTESSLRYAAYANRLRIVLAAQRYVAYTSDIGESFRPVVRPAVVTAAYGISWSYVIGDVAYEGYKAHLREREFLESKSRGEDLTGKEKPNWMLTVVQRGIFQSIASMGLPAFTIHSTVKYSGKAMKNVKNVRLRTWGPVGLGLAVVPALPYLFDEPVEEAVEWVFEQGKAAYKDFNKKDL